MDVKKCNVLAAEIRLETLKVIHSRGFGHVGGSMDLADLMAVLYGEVMKFDPKNPRWEDRDWLVLSKGHAGPVAYATFGLMGFYPMEEAYTLNQPTIAQTRPVIPMIVSIMVQDFKVVFSSISRRELTSQKPESFTWLKAVAPPLMAQTIAAR